MKAGNGFTFKRFHINHDRCAMKVGTDGILLGAWADLANSRSILDLGTGSGLIALMLAQRSDEDVQIHGVERDPAAARQAQENFRASPWAHRLYLHFGDIADFAQKCGQKFDNIVANPPYFAQGVDCRNHARNAARYTAALSHAQWLEIASSLLTEQGTIHFVLPAEQGKTLKQSTALYCVRQCDVISKQGKAAQRVLLSFMKEKKETAYSELTIYDEKNRYTLEFIQLTREFYLKF
ncbi:tRNA (adenosine(37)-N6)-methyltransferase TrmM [Actinobacillus succinogenes]|uniref:tRNA1(Val) (adenine(37)-N6)-methyltransferase n=1 Tax=Actinobacillus succinogenes (strain ATCC 55618 / DSM 22257 / CCUG 43843 / 130Z) TaxID=339671 RepID=TRMN6_ACTSZ|nr:tRNA1(Val) (adenine(37)-N6)-methyltransferase [Actinobacillus succinogenes]A6VKA4.1 RecName: Full=tRNA1(Val) (adenine(37)-N6)-methyltransferase; AltName: Full=tRNA m6A37 methyltransferase [Actinobacillus succinogenes 130Z]ABR73401.1 Methyltransferase type 12 [Actinobacillus succinogenes 130Z]PHI40132.1 tRNA (adenosine(37)-N6)-methyltransferase TrmM [Actinobacillus succinogenes]